jgi:hypothetical protein
LDVLLGTWTWGRDRVVGVGVIFQREGGRWHRESTAGELGPHVLDVFESDLNDLVQGHVMPDLDGEDGLGDE